MYKWEYHSQILYQGLTKCDLYDRIYQNLLNNPEPDTSIYKFNQNYSDLYEYLSEHIGMVRMRITYLIDIGIHTHSVLFLMQNRM